MRKQNPLANFDGHFSQVIIYYNEVVPVRFHKESRTSQIICPVVFTDPANAVTYGGMYVNELIESGELPADVKLGNGELDPAKVKVGINPLVVGSLELFDDED